MIATVDIKHPKLQNYSQEELEKIINEAVYSYFDDDAENDINLYPIQDDELSEHVKEKFALLDKMTPEERRKKFVNFSL